MRNALAVGLLTLTVWMCVLDGPYRFDDHLVPLGDPASQSLAALSDHLTFTLRPLTKLTYALEASVGLADSAPARRAVSVVIHAVGAVLLALLLAHIADDTRGGLLALVWALHPVHAEAMLAVSGRSGWFPSPATGSSPSSPSSAALGQRASWLRSPRSRRASPFTSARTS